uniref:Putative secreted protein n=1 Tax=Amblyomma triste TaxID=251400 RepID=A0A023G2V5_AMBTT
MVAFKAALLLCVLVLPAAYCQSAAEPPRPDINWGKCPQLQPSKEERQQKALVIDTCLEKVPLPDVEHANEVSSVARQPTSSYSVAFCVAQPRRRRVLQQESPPLETLHMVRCASVPSPPPLGAAKGGAASSACFASTPSAPSPNKSSPRESSTLVLLLLLCISLTR